MNSGITGWVSRGALHLLTALLYIAFVAAFNGYVGARVVTDDLLAPRFYADALNRSDIYDRIYTELLADPALQAVTSQLLGDIYIDASYSENIYSYAASTLRLVLPPNVIRQAVEAVLVELTAYLAGERDRLDAHLKLSKAFYSSDLIKNITAGIVALKADLIAQAYAHGVVINEQPLFTSNLYPALAEYAQALARGEVRDLPVDVLVASLSAMSDEEKQQIIVALLSPLGGRVSEMTKQQIEAELADNDLLGAILIAAQELIRPHVLQAILRLRLQLARGELKGLESLSELTRLSQREIIGELNDTRDLVRLLREDLVPLAILVMGGAFVAQILLYVRRPWAALRVVGLMLILAGLSLYVSWRGLGYVLNTPYAAIRHPYGWSLPPSLRHMLSDMLATLESQLWRAVRARALPPVLVGIVFTALSYWHPVSAGAVRVLRPLARRPRLAAGLAAVIVIVVPLTGDWVLVNQPSAIARDMQCNGHEELCDRPLNEVVFAATHNAMSISSEGWVWPSHDHSLTAQLEAGVRAMLIDTHYWDKTYQIESYLNALPPTLRPTVEQIIQVRADPEQPGAYLCHWLCSLGATPLVGALGEITRWLDLNPFEVLVFIIQDAITPADTVKAFEDSGLIRYVYVHRPGDPWPTLGAMIERNERVFVLAEVAGPPPDWYHHAWDYVEETPYTYQSPADFSCAPNRGGTDRPFFLLNHWITRQSPSRVDAALVNAYDFLLTRVQHCARDRGRIPNFIAVNFSSIGDVFDVVDTLNEVGKAAAP